MQAQMDGCVRLFHMTQYNSKRTMSYSGVVCHIPGFRPAVSSNFVTLKWNLPWHFWWRAQTYSLDAAATADVDDDLLDVVTDLPKVSNGPIWLKRMLPKTIPPTDATMLWESRKCNSLCLCRMAFIFIITNEFRLHKNTRFSLSFFARKDRSWLCGIRLCWTRQVWCNSTTKPSNTSLLSGASTTNHCALVYRVDSMEFSVYVSVRLV